MEIRELGHWEPQGWIWKDHTQKEVSQAEENYGIWGMFQEKQI